jgi:hypothetical protein
MAAEDVDHHVEEDEQRRDPDEQKVKGAKSNDYYALVPSCS